MKNINGKEFFELLESENEIIHEGYLIQIDQELIIKTESITTKNTIVNCKFSGKGINITGATNVLNSKRYISDLSFENCHFNNYSFIISDCYFSSLMFINLKSICNNFVIQDSHFNILSFENPQNSFGALKNEINLNSIWVERVFEITSLTIESSLNILNCLGINCDTKIRKCTFKSVNINNSVFKSEFQFNNNTLIEKSVFNHNKFQKTNFEKTNFGIDTVFYENDFLGTTLFTNVKSEKSKLEFRSCKFEKYSYFNNSILKELSIDTSKFLEVASFQDIKLHSIFIDRTLFEKTAFFDDIYIKQVKKTDKRTLRNIKRQLSVTENRIDYNKFRKYELSAYGRDLKRLIKNNSTLDKKSKKQYKRDLCILKIHESFSNFGTDWVKSLLNTILCALILYLILFVIHNFDKQFNISKIDDFFIGFFEYSIITNFDSPFKDDARYLTSSIEWFVFIMGKVFIGFGVYETIQSFRKFRK